MAITAEVRNDLIGLLVGMFDAAPNAELLTQFVAALEGGATVASLAEDLAATSEFASLYPVWLTNDEFATNFATNILDGNTDAATLAEGIDFVKGLLNGGSTRGEVANIAVSALMAVPTTDAKWGQAAQALENKIDVATYFATTKLTAGAEFNALRAVVADVTADTATVSAQKILIDAGLDSAAQVLTTGQDFLTGSAGNDMFTAWIFNNSNTAQSGDSINGGAGTDTLMAEVGNSQNFAISLKTNSVEVAQFRAQAAAIDSGDNNVTSGSGEGGDGNAQVDAGDMVGTVQFWSTDSRANLVIEDVQALSHTVTLGWRNADAGNVNYEVYFDNISAPGATTAGSQLFLEVLDLEGMRTDGEPLKNNPYVGLQFNMDSTLVNIAAPNPVQTTYADLVAGINALLVAQGITTVTASLGSAFSAINSDNGVAYQGTTIVLTNTGPEVLTGIGWNVNGILPPDSNVHTSIDDTPPATATQRTQTDVIFDYVGSGSKAGDFIAGEISQKGSSNSGTPGIEQFNIDVDRTSWVDEVKSTEDTLEAVYVENIGSNGNLRIDVLDNVQIFDASAMVGNLRLSATLDSGVISKYFNLVDSQADESADNIEFAYTGGAGNDRITLSVAEEAIAYEDFELLVSGGAGNDTIFVSVANTDASLNVNWQADQALLNNYVVSTGAGDDTVTTFGDGRATITTGTGADTVYSDNSGIDNANSPATWLFNAANVDLNDIQGNGNGRFFLQDSKLTVTFSGGSANSGLTAGNATNLAADQNGWASTVTVPTTNGVATSADINQAIKDAINTDSVLSKLLVATDGPNHSLIVTSKIDGVYTVLDLDVSIQATTAAALTTAATFNTVESTYRTFIADSTVALTDAILDAQAEAAGAAFTGLDVVDSLAGTAGTTTDSQVFGQIGGADQVGADSDEGDNDNIINVGTGDDVVVLSTDATTQETIVYTDVNFGVDVIVNFANGGAMGDILDFTAFLTDIVSASTSVESQQRVATTVNAAATLVGDAAIALGANEVAVFNNFVAAGTETWSALTGVELLAAINDSNVGGAADYGNIGENDLEAQGATVNLVGTVRNSLVLVENNANDGEYKVFHLTTDNTASNDFTAATLLGVIDLGETAAFTAADFA